MYQPTADELNKTLGEKHLAQQLGNNVGVTYSYCNYLYLIHKLLKKLYDDMADWNIIWCLARVVNLMISLYQDSMPLTFPFVGTMITQPRGKNVLARGKCILRIFKTEHLSKHR